MRKENNGENNGENDVKWDRRKAAGPALALLVSIAFFAVTNMGGEYGFWGGLGYLMGERQDTSIVDFASLTRLPNLDDALSCPPDYCLSAALDAVAPIVNISALELDRRFRDYLERASRAKPLPTDNVEWRRRAVFYDGWWRIPDVIDIEIAPIDGDHATLAIYSRSVVGLGVVGLGAATRNKKRLFEILDALGRGSTLTG